MGEFMRLDEWDDFTEIATGSSQVFYQVNNGERELIAYAGRVFYKDDDIEDKDTLEFYLDDLRVLRGKRVLETSDSVFR